MGLFSLINKIRIGFIRSKENSIPCESSIKKYGNFGEDKFVRDIQQVLPDCQIKRNVLVSSSDGNLITITIRNYKLDNSLDLSAFRLNTKELGKDYVITDLR